MSDLNELRAKVELAEAYQRAQARIRELEGELAAYRQRSVDRFVAMHSLDDNPEAESVDEEIRNRCTPEERAVLEAAERWRDTEYALLHFARNGLPNELGVLVDSINRWLQLRRAAGKGAG